ncbi:MAG TPA: penicillin-binding protein activator LpoB [Verrucomicrobiae bacterium]
MKIKLGLSLVAGLSCVVLTGCGTDAHYVQTGDKEQIVSLNQINIQDYANAANDAIKDLLASGVLDRAQNHPALLELSRIVNKTAQQVDTDLLTKKISIALLQSGKAVTKSVDQKSSEYEQFNNAMNDKQGSAVPDFTLSGKIIETVDRAGSTRRTTYSFQLSLNDTKNAVQVWEGEKEIGKQGTRSSVGF